MSTEEATNDSLRYYRYFKGIWRDIDNDNLTKLANHPNLQHDLNLKQQGVTPLFLACQRKNDPIIHFLLQAGADPNIECKGITPLYLCCLYGGKQQII
jgi:ankyrin repeat protein